MQLINPFQKKEPSQEALMQKQQDYAMEQEAYSSSINPTPGEVQENESFHDRQNQMAELTRWQQDLNPMLQDVFFTLSGLMMDSNGKLIPDPMNEPHTSIIFAKRWIGNLKTVDKNIMNGAWSLQQINQEIIEFRRNLRQDIKEHHLKYNIEYSIATFDYICETLTKPIHGTYLRGLENGERKYHGQIQKVIETKNIMPEKKKNSIFGKE